MKNHILTLLLLCSQIAFSQSYDSYFTGNTVDLVASPLGGTCLMGGATENDDAMRWFLNRANGGDVLVLRASGSDGYNDYFYSQLAVTLNSVETIVFNNASAANETYIHQKIQQAEAIWFAGGDQWDYISYWRNTPIQTLINEGIQNRSIAIGGTSAGMAIQGGFYFSAENGTVTSTQVLDNPYHINATVDNTPFFKNSYLENVITDTHYDNPDRKGRHAAFLARIKTDWGQSAFGIACEEYTAVCIDPNGIAQVFGEHPTYDDFAYFIQVNCELNNQSPENCQANTALTWDLNQEALKVYKIPGTSTGNNTFDLNDWKTASGGEWQNWWIDNGTFYEVPSTPIVDCITSVPDITLGANCLMIQPTMTDSNFVVEGSLQDYTIQILDATGMVYQTLNSNNSPLQVDVSNLPNGLYFISIINNNYSSLCVKKVLKF